MEWKKYINQNSNSKKYSADCQLVTTVNAYYHLTNKLIKQSSKKYKELAELCGCCYGPCINIEKAWSFLGIVESKRVMWYDLNDFLKENCFIEISIWHKRYGFHSVAIVDFEPKTQSVRVTNFKWATNTQGWIFLEDLKPHIVDNPNRDKPIWNARTFELVQ